MKKRHPSPYILLTLCLSALYGHVGVKGVVLSSTSPPMAISQKKATKTPPEKLRSKSIGGKLFKLLQRGGTVFFISWMVSWCIVTIGLLEPHLLGYLRGNTLCYPQRYPFRYVRFASFLLRPNILHTDGRLDTVFLRRMRLKAARVLYLAVNVVVFMVVSLLLYVYKWKKEDKAWERSQEWRKAKKKWHWTEWVFLALYTLVGLGVVIPLLFVVCPPLLKRANIPSYMTYTVLSGINSLILFTVNTFLLPFFIGGFYVLPFNFIGRRYDAKKGKKAPK